MFKGAIFDVDGTLLDTMSVWHGFTRDFLKKRGFELSVDDALIYKDMILAESLPLIKDKFSLPDTEEEMFEEFKQMGEYAYKNTVSLKPYADEYLKMLHDEGIKIAVATSGYPELCYSAFKRLGIYNYIDGYAFSNEVGVNKGRPDVYLLAAERIGVDPHDCMVYEDLLLGLSGAKKGGFMTTAVYDETNADDTLALKQLCDHYITGWEQLLQR